RLAKFQHVEVSLVLMDPVPGNLLVSASLDFLNQTLANQALDLSECHTLKNVLAIYTSTPFPSYLFHAPLIATYPRHCSVQTEIVPGMHSDAQAMFDERDDLYGNNTQSALTFALVCNFLNKQNTLFKL